MTISQMLLPEFDQEMANTRKLLERVPAEKFSFVPHARSMPLGRLASHVAELPGWSAFVVDQDKLELGPGNKPFLAGSPEELVAAFDRNVADARRAIAGAADEHLLREWSLVFGGHTAFTLPRATVLRSVVMNHMIHHRAQLGVYLRLLEVPIPGMYGPSADDRAPAAKA